MRIENGGINWSGAKKVYNHRHQLVSLGNRKMRAHIIVECDDNTKKQYDVHVKKIGKKTPKKIDSKKWIKMRVGGEEVLANISSLAKRTGLSKEMLRAPAFQNDPQKLERALADKANRKRGQEKGIGDGIRAWQTAEAKKVEKLFNSVDRLLKKKTDRSPKRTQERKVALAKEAMRMRQGGPPTRALMFADELQLEWGRDRVDEVMIKIENQFERYLENGLSDENLERLEERFEAFLKYNGWDAGPMRSKIMAEFRSELRKINEQVPPPLQEEEIYEVAKHIAPHLDKMRSLDNGILQKKWRSKFAAIKVGKRKVKAEANLIGIKVNGHQYKWIEMGMGTIVNRPPMPGLNMPR